MVEQVPKETASSPKPDENILPQSDAANVDGDVN